MFKFSEIFFALALSIIFANPTFAIDEIFDPLADLYSDLEEKTEVEIADGIEDDSTESATTADDYIIELQEMATRMETVANGETTTIATEPETVEPAEGNPIESPTEAQISQSGGAIEDVVDNPLDSLKTTEPEVIPLVAEQNPSSEVFVFEYIGGAAATHSVANELTAAGPVAIALFALAGGFVGAYFFQRKIFDV